MARTITPKDCYTLINAIVEQATGQQELTAVDTSSFISAGELVLSTGMENVFNAISVVLNKTIIAARPYSSKLNLIQAEDADAYNSRLRKISYYSKKALPSGAFNTDLFTNFAQSFTAGQNENSSGTAQSTKSQWEQNPPIPLEVNFAGVSTWQEGITMYEDAVKFAFTSEAEFARFVEGYLMEHANDIESEKEAWNRAAIINKIASVTAMNPYMPESVIDLTVAYNLRFGTDYTGQELRTTYLKSFLEFFVATFKTISNFMEERSANYHWSPAKTINGETYTLLRHTPKRDQRVLLYGPLYKEAEAMVLPEIFNPDYLDLETQFEEVSFWQSQSDRAAINVTPAITDVTTGQQTSGEAQDIPYVVGMIFDRDALMTSYRLDSARSTVLEARKGYRNVWNTFARNTVSDNTENCVVFIMGEGK